MLEAKIAGDLNAIMAAEIKASEAAVTAAVGEAGLGLQRELRAQIAGAGLGRRLANAVRFNLYPDKGTSLSAAAFVYARPGKGGRGGAADIVAAFEEGVLIRRNGGHWLAIPTANVPRRARGRRATPADLESAPRFGGLGQDLELVPTNRPGVMLLVQPVVRAKNGRGFRPATPRRLQAGREREFVVMFILVRQVRLGKRLDWKAPTDAWAAKLPDLVARKMETLSRGQ
jgi:hypothetical protein